MLAGILLLAAALALVIYNYLESEKAGQESAEVLTRLEDMIRDTDHDNDSDSGDDLSRDESGDSEIHSEESSGQDPEKEPGSGGGSEGESSDNPYENLESTPEMKTLDVDGSRYIGILEIPELSIRLPVMSEWSYARLKISPCRYCGSYYTNDLVICGHNYARHFSPIKNIRIGAKVNFITTTGSVYQYTVVNRETVQPTNVDKMIDRDADWDLTLFTCNTGGRTRCAVRCELLNS